MEQELYKVEDRKAFGLKRDEPLYRLKPKFFLCCNCILTCLNTKPISFIGNMRAWDDTECNSKCIFEKSAFIGYMKFWLQAQHVRCPLQG